MPEVSYVASANSGGQAETTGIRCDPADLVCCAFVVVEADHAE